MLFSDLISPWRFFFLGSIVKEANKSTLYRKRDYRRSFKGIQHCLYFFPFYLFVFVFLFHHNLVGSFFLQIFVPVLRGDHWTLVVVELRTEVITVLDSLYDNLQDYHWTLVRFFST